MVHLVFVENVGIASPIKASTIIINLVLNGTLHSLPFTLFNTHHFAGICMILQIYMDLLIVACVVHYVVIFCTHARSLSVFAVFMQRIKLLGRPGWRSNLFRVLFIRVSAVDSALHCMTAFLTYF